VQVREWSTFEKDRNSCWSNTWGPAPSYQAILDSENKDLSFEFDADCYLEIVELVGLSHCLWIYIQN
jgi:hypothetical protein